MTDYKTILEVINENIKASDYLIEKGYRLQAFFLLIPIFEVIGEYINGNKDDSNALFINGFSHIFNELINIDTKIQFYKIYVTIRCGLFHGVKITDEGKEITETKLFRNENNKIGIQSQYTQCDISLTDEGLLFSKKKVILGVKDTHDKLQNFFLRSEIIDDPFFNKPSFFFIEQNKASSGISIVNRVVIS